MAKIKKLRLVDKIRVINKAIELIEGSKTENVYLMDAVQVSISELFNNGDYIVFIAERDFPEIKDYFIHKYGKIAIRLLKETRKKLFAKYGKIAFNVIEVLLDKNKKPFPDGGYSPKCPTECSSEPVKPFFKEECIKYPQNCECKK